MIRNLLSRYVFLAAILGLSIGALAQFGAGGSRPLEDWRTAVDRLLQANPDARVSTRNGKVSRVYGNVPVGTATPFVAAHTFVGSYAAAFGAGAGDLRLARVADIDYGRLKVFWFAQYHWGIPVEASGLTVLVATGIVNDVVLASPIIRPVPDGSPIGLMRPGSALAAVNKQMPYADDVSEPRLVVWGRGEGGHYAYQIEASTRDLTKPERWTFFVDARTGSVLEKRDGIFYVDIEGHLDAWRTPGALPDAGYNPPVLRNLPGSRARVIGGNFAYADATGDYLIPHGGSSLVTVEAALFGRYVRVENQAGANDLLTQDVTPPGPADFVFNTLRTEFLTSQVNAMIHTEVVRNFAKGINPAYPGLGIQMIANVNINNNCNAFYNGSSINFYTAGGGCPNTAYTSVVYHEYGHHIVASGHNSPGGALHEGMSDVTSSLLLNDPVIGRDFRGPGTNVRDVDLQDVSWPCGGGSHFCGLVLGGSFWDTRTELRATMGPQAGLDHARFLYLNVLLLSPPFDPDFTIDVLTLDDDDNNITNGTPHYDEINAGFSAHGLPAPTLQLLLFETDPEDLTFLPANRPISFVVRIRPNASSYRFGTAKIHFRINGGDWNERPLFSLWFSPGLTGVIPEWAFLGVEPPGTLIEWYLSARDVQGRLSTDVDPLTPHQSLTAETVTTLLDDNFELDLGWTVQNIDLQDGQWERGVPRGGGDRGDPPTDYDGSGQCFATDLADGNSDVDGGPTIVISPVFNMAGGNGIIDLAYWFFNDDGDDILALEISNDGGGSWRPVKSWQGGGGGWKTLSFVVSKYVTPSANMQIRLRVADNPNNSVTEAGLDAVRIRRAS
ncbi:MAG: PepSY domain-containing protein [Armatimonadetes bacterium]|nr:PepSY domain-containing protein [Armatimonadota bacterium]